MVGQKSQSGNQRRNNGACDDHSDQKRILLLKHENNGSGHNGRQRNECSPSEEIERGEKSNGQCPKTTNPECVSVREPRQNHTNEVGGEDCFIPGPKRQRTQAEKDEDDPFRPDSGSSMGVNAGQPPAGERQY